MPSVASSTTRWARLRAASRSRSATRPHWPPFGQAQRGFHRATAGTGFRGRVPAVRDLASPAPPARFRVDSCMRTTGDPGQPHMRPLSWILLGRYCSRWWPPSDGGLGWRFRCGCWQQGRGPRSPRHVGEIDRGRDRHWEAKTWTPRPRTGTDGSTCDPGCGALRIRRLFCPAHHQFRAACPFRAKALINHRAGYPTARTSWLRGRRSKNPPPGPARNRGSPRRWRGASSSAEFSSSTSAIV
jgi:hypothetical protein